ncbi:MAG: aldo/keto reductase [Thermoguttaceae bacterium]|nr:aldo/keto reductase [Thermoguttaceae bacterium]
MLKRRDFLHSAVQAVAAAGVSGNATVERSSGGIPTRTLGKTGLKVPILGYGGAALPKVWLNPLSYEERVALVRYAFDRGIRYFDTAGNYMESQRILGEALKDRRREVCLVTKVETTNPQEVRGAVEKSLRELQTDYVDILLIHGQPGLEQMTVQQAMKIHAELVKLRDEKITRFVGFSAHGHFEKALALISSGGFEVCMLSYGYLPLGYQRVYSARTIVLRDACLAKAHELGMGIVAMKVLGAGMLGAWSGYLVRDFDSEQLAELPAAAIRHVLNDPRVHVLTIGMRLTKEIDFNLAVISGDTTYTLQDRALLANFCAKLYETDRMKNMRIE